MPTTPNPPGSLVTLVALQATPHGVKPGATFETTEAIAAILIKTGIARRTTEDSKARRRYFRRDLEAEE